MSRADADGPPPPRPLVRPVEGRLVAGVALGVAQHLGLEVRLVRICFVVTAVLNGAGLLAYALLWAFAPQDGRARDLGARVEHARRTGRPAAVEAAQRAAVAGAEPSARVGGFDGERIRVLGVGVVLVVLAVAVFASRAGVDLRWQLTGPLLVVLTGAAIGLAQLDDAERRRWLTPVGGTGPGALARLALGVLLAVAGVLLLVAQAVDIGQLTLVAGATVAVLAGVALVLAPWAVRLWRDLESERSLRVRETERAEIAAHLHDSVLQTLSLIQRRPGDPIEVARLARSQERELRDWIYGAEMRAGAPDAPSSVRDAVRAVCAEVEDAEGVPVELVVVGDAPGDEQTTALVQALREALLNAVRHGRTGVTVFVECADGGVEAFVRDRGPGFDLDAVPADRLGVRRSVIGRMERHGGRAVIRPAPGGGTEVSLVLPPRTAPDPHDAAGPGTAPVTDHPITDHPVTDHPITDHPVTDPPVTDHPVTDHLAQERTPT